MVAALCAGFQHLFDSSTFTASGIEQFKPKKTIQVCVVCVLLFLPDLFNMFV